MTNETRRVAGFFCAIGIVAAQSNESIRVAGHLFKRDVGASQQHTRIGILPDGHCRGLPRNSMFPFPEVQVWEIKKTLYRHGHRYARSKERSVRDKSVEVTGVVLLRAGVVAPNRQHAKIAKVRDDLARTASVDQRKALEGQLRGRLAQVGQIAAADLRRKA